jgi:hypothetical protein
MSTVNNMDKHPFKPKIADYTQISADNGISHAVQLYCGGKIHPVTSFGYRILGSNEETKEELWRDEGIIDYRYFMSK